MSHALEEMSLENGLLSERLNVALGVDKTQLVCLGESGYVDPLKSLVVSRGMANAPMTFGFGRGEVCRRGGWSISNEGKTPIGKPEPSHSLGKSKLKSLIEPYAEGGLVEHMD